MTLFLLVTHFISGIFRGVYGQKRGGGIVSQINSPRPLMITSHTVQKRGGGIVSQINSPRPLMITSHTVAITDRTEFILKTRMSTTQTTADKGDSITSSDSAADKDTEAAETMALPTTRPALSL